MKILIYNDLDESQINGFDKICQHLEQDDFRSADVKKVADNLYRARLNRTDRLLFSIYRYKDCAYALILEYIKSHRYEKSRFLRRGVKIDENRIPSINKLEDTTIENLSFLNEENTRLNYLDKPISFDAPQTTIFGQPLPLIIIGSAGSGKTTLILEKVKKMRGEILYVSQSPYLVETSRALYQSNSYKNNSQKISFLTFEEFIESIEIPQGKAINSQIFQDWFARILQSSPIKDGYKLFEEFRGVISGSINGQAYLNKEEYLALGVKQSIFLENERADVYALFQRYLSFTQEENYYDVNLICHSYLNQKSKSYNFVIIDEVQDLTNIQIALVLKSLKSPQNFLLCGDANQVVHPNFFSWTKIKSLFFQKNSNNNQPPIQVLHGNYRNSADVTQVANKVLKLKSQRFGSLDKESHYLMTAKEGTLGRVMLLPNKPEITKELNLKTKDAANYAVIVINETAKHAARSLFQTPLIFTIQEAKGLEYDNIILFDFISSNESRYRNISQGVHIEDLEKDLSYSRNKDKTDKSSETYKFHINALYVAITRAVHNIYWLESTPKQNILRLIGLANVQSSFSIDKQKSSSNEWQREVQRLEKQGNKRQANQIREKILKQTKPNWPVYDTKNILELKHQALEQHQRKAKLTLFEYSLVYDDHLYRNALIAADFKPALNPDNGYSLLHKKYFMSYQSKNLRAVTQLIHRYGVNFRNTFNQTSLMIATQYGNTDLIHLLIQQKADKDLANNRGQNAFQIALYLAWKGEEYAHEKLISVYLALSPDSLDLCIDKQYIRLDKHSTEFLVINLLMALFYEVLPQKMIFTGGGFTPQDIIEAFGKLPPSLIDKKLYDPTYISQIFSTHKVHSESPHGLKLFYRVMPDNYLINPAVSLRINKEWVNIYDLLSFDQLSLAHQKKLGIIDTDSFYSNVLEEMKVQYKTVLGLMPNAQEEIPG